MALPALQTQAAMRDVAAQSLAATTALQRSVARLTEPLRSIQLQAKKAMQDLAVGWGKWGAEFERLLDTHSRYPAVMAALGWPPATDLGTSDVAAIVRGYDELGASPSTAAKNGFAEVVGQNLVTFYDDDLVQRKLDTWRSKRLLTKRLPILEAAVRAHCEGNYVLAVPALLAQTEGVVADGFSHRGQMGGPAYEKYVRGLFAGGTREQLSAAVDKAVVDFWKGVLYVSFDHGGPIKSRLSRHAIMHGGDVEFDPAGIG